MPKISRVDAREALKATKKGNAVGLDHIAVGYTEVSRRGRSGGFN